MAAGLVLFLVGLAIVLRTVAGPNGGLASKSGPLRRAVGA
jgi:hypothetical protein